MTAEIPENTLIRVEWDDTFLPGGAWHEREDVVDRAKDEELIISIGFLVWSDERFVAMASSMWAPDSQVSGLFYIPQGCIRRVRVLNEDGETVFDDGKEEE
jgi:hypothetical protein